MRTAHTTGTGDPDFNESVTNSYHRASATIIIIMVLRGNMMLWQVHLVLTKSAGLLWA